MNRVLLTVSGSIDLDIEGQIGRGERPVADYLAMADGFQADLMDYEIARSSGGRIGRLMARIAGANLMLAWACFACRSQYDVIITDGEQIGIPLAMLLKLSGDRRPRHLMIGHFLSAKKKLPFFDVLHVQNQIDLFFVYSSWQKRFIESRWRVPSEEVVLTSFMVDSDFFSPTAIVESENVSALAEDGRPIICSVGLEFRDYATLMAAVDGLDILVIIAADSPWSKRKENAHHQDIPANVIVERFSQYELRYLYALSRFVVMPLYNVNFQAGVTAILEAMAMEKGVICSKTIGQTDVIVDGLNGLYVSPEDPAELREAILFLLDNPDQADQMGRHGRQLVEEASNLDSYVGHMNSYLALPPEEKHHQSKTIN